ncbi:hypothetical protein SAMN05444695_11272 [Rhodococcus triatomae]|uniref:Integral membrane protein n=1 Tax=Rhodococcus triatomae TaxID=300028 RepID=A0A1G8P5U4_9NOCA|nr:DUF6790 family protein [Rhodococcus triatomae]SDI87833.1 hypothetical protein SAMN05444695_11272 [Rhodococcus triatomae]
MSVFVAVLAIIGALVHTVRSRSRPRSPATVVDIFLAWWLVVAVGAGGIIGAAYHVFDGPAIAESIGYTRGDGGFQFENAMGDLALGVLGVLCVRFRGYFWLATIIALTIQYWGDAGGHLYFWIAQDNTKPDNIGAPLVADILLPIVAWALYLISVRRGGAARQPSGGAAQQPSGGAGQPDSPVQGP